MSSTGMASWLSGPVRTLLVDLDGTLLGSRKLRLKAEFTARAWLGLVRRFGIARGTRALRVVRGALESPPAAERSMVNAERVVAAFARETSLGLAEAESALHEIVNGIFPRLAHLFHPVPGASEFIAWASKRYRLVLATNPVWPIEFVHLRLGWAGIDPSVFEAITHSKRMHHCKPAVEYYEELLSQVGLRASDCVLVGDDCRKDLPAVRAGIAVFILASGTKRGCPELAGAKARAQAGTFPELRRLLQGVSA